MNDQTTKQTKQVEGKVIKKFKMKFNLDKPKHTPTPLKNTNWSYTVLQDLTLPEDTKLHIVRCVNAHDELVEALTMLALAVKVPEDQETGHDYLGEALVKAKQALKKAGA
jgi:hypothetical protein